ncbi:MAG: hypothetical protein U0175_24470 [Caldilineaceae bacterium]
MLFQAYSWSIDIPETWLGKVDESCWTFSAQDPIGALQISLYEKGEVVTDQDLLEFLEEHIADLNLAHDVEGSPKVRKVDAGQFLGYSIQYGIVEDGNEEEQRWQVWWLRSSEIMLFVTYICASSEIGIEDPIVDSILQSLERTMN